MNKKEIFSGIINAILFTPVAAAIGFIIYVMIIFSGGSKFYTTLTIAMTIAAVLFIGAFSIFKLRTFIFSFIVFLVITGSAVVRYEIQLSYYNNLNTVNDQGVELSEYEPFRTETKAVKLDEPATFVISENLPRLDGATALYPLYAAFAQAVYPKGEYLHQSSEVVSSNTVYAYDHLMNGEADIIFAAEPSVEQLEKAKQLGIELKLEPVGREAFVFFVQKDNPVKGLTLHEIQSIYSGEITNWKELGGKNAKIKAYQRPENSGSQTILQKLMKDRPIMTPPKETIATGMGDIINRTSDYRNYPNAIGYSFLFFATEMIKNGEIRLLEIEQINPERSTINNSTYPLTANFYAITAGTNNPNVVPFIEWIKSEQGQYLVEKTGYTPLIEN